MPENFRIADREFHSRLIVGTGKYRSFQEMQRCHEASGAAMVTVAVRRVNLTDRSKEWLLEAKRILGKEGFVVLPYTNDDVVNARKLIDAGAAAFMPLAAPIGSGLGIQNSVNLRIFREMITEVPVIVDAGVGTASDATIAMELGADGVLMNTAIAAAEDSVKMARAMRLAGESGREAFLAGRIARKMYASASSPVEGLVGR